MNLTMLTTARRFQTKRCNQESGKQLNNLATVTFTTQSTQNWSLRDHPTTLNSSNPTQASRVVSTTTTSAPASWTPQSRTLLPQRPAICSTPTSSHPPPATVLPTPAEVTQPHQMQPPEATSSTKCCSGSLRGPPMAEGPAREPGIARGPRDTPEGIIEKRGKSGGWSKSGG